MSFPISNSEIVGIMFSQNKVETFSFESTKSEKNFGFGLTKNEFLP